jgi:hypothetical protein
VGITKKAVFGAFTDTVKMKTDATFAPDGPSFARREMKNPIAASGTLHFLIMLSLVTFCPRPLH